jgi:hypothetical protein
VAAQPDNCIMHVNFPTVHYSEVFRQSIPRLRYYKAKPVSSRKIQACMYACSIQMMFEYQDSTLPAHQLSSFIQFTQLNLLASMLPFTL